MTRRSTVGGRGGGGGGGGRGGGGGAGGGGDGEDLGAGHEACFYGAVDLVADFFAEQVEEGVENVDFELWRRWGGRG